MKNYTLIFCLYFLVLSVAFSQENLIPNGDFEELQSDSLIHNNLQPKEFPTQMKDWNSPSFASPDVVNPKLWYETIAPAISGKYAAGLLVNSYSNSKKQIKIYTEYVQCQLKEPLKVGQKYLIKFDIAGNNLPIDSSRYFGMGLSKKSIFSFHTGILKMIPHVKLNKPLKREWQTVVDFFVADEAYEHVIMGFFDTKTNLKRIFYAVDNISIVAVNDKTTATDYFHFMGEEITLSNVHFDTNSSELLPSSFSELEKAAQWLYNHPKYVIEIQGHTDHEGREDKNLKLSKERAKAVQTFFKEKGIPSFQLKTKGFGESNPIADNTTVQGRAANRRVVIKKVNLLLKSDLYAEVLKSVYAEDYENAFEILEHIIKIGNLPMKILADADLTALHTDERWARVKEAIFKDFQLKNTFRQPTLAYELETMLLENQAISQADSVFWAQTRPFKGAFKPKKANFKVINKKHTKQLEELLGKHDILPHRGLIGMSGIFGILTVVQQSEDVDFQKRWLQKMKNTMKRYSEYRVVVAYLTDKIAVKEGRQQTYGTQRTQSGQLYPIEDTPNLNVRRKKMNLPRLYFKK